MVDSHKAERGAMQSEASKRGNQRYKREKTKQLAIRFYPTDMDLLEYIKSKDNVAQYIKNLVRAEMEANQ